MLQQCADFRFASSESPEDFLAGATQNAGSWWTHWNQWVTSLPGGDAKVKARLPEDGALAEDASKLKNDARRAESVPTRIAAPAAITGKSRDKRDVGHGKPHPVWNARRD